MDMAVSTDTIGGSSGSPAINARGQIIGANFDSTVLTQRNAYGYDRAVNRSVIVTTQAVTVALRDVYGMDHLVEELGVTRANAEEGLRSENPEIRRLLGAAVGVREGVARELEFDARDGRLIKDEED